MLAEKVTFHFRASILDKLPEDIQDKVAVAGGCIRDKLVGDAVKDIDLFVQDKETEDKLMAFLKEKGKEGVVNSMLANYTFEDRWIQVIRGKYYDMKTTALIDSFDYTLCMAMITSDGLKVGQFFYEALATKHIRVNRLDFPLASLERLQKYIKKGYFACNGTMLAISKAINDLDKSVFETVIDGDMASANLQQNSLMFYSDGTPRFIGVD